MVTEQTSYEVFEGLFGVQSTEDPKADEKSKQLQYWQKCSGIYNGRTCPIHTQELRWITLGPVMSKFTATEYYDFQRSKHATPLEKYGKYSAGKSSIGAENSKYNVVDPERRFEPLIELNGLKEIPLDQMIAYNWHRIPVIVKYIPQLAEVQDYTCPHCAGKVFTHTDHLRTHINAKHESVAQPQAIGQEISKAIAAVGSNSMSPEAIAAIVMAVREGMKAETPK